MVGKIDLVKIGNFISDVNYKILRAIGKNLPLHVGKYILEKTD